VIRDRRAQDRLRILVAHSFYRNPGGEDRYVRQQIELLRPHHEVQIFGRQNDSLRASVSTATKMAFSLQVLRAVEEHIDRFAPDVIHLHNPYPSLGPAIHLAATRRGVPLVQTMHNLRLRCPNGLMFTEGLPCRRCEAGNYTHAALHRCFPTRSQATAYAAALWSHRFAMGLEQRVDAFIAPSSFMSAQLTRWGIPEDRVWTIRNFVPSFPPVSSVLGDYGTYVGRLSSEKGLDVLLRALSLADDPAFRIIGDGPMRPELIDLTSRLGLKRTILTGRLDSSEVNRIVSESRFLVMPSLCDENAPLAVLECMAAGRPVLVSEKGGLPELIERGGGMSFGPGDARSMAEKMRALLSDDELCIEMGVRARQLAEEQLSADGHLRRLQELYREVQTTTRARD
jgi:glycosyltransferase involved in cell wall biosynthesis